MIVSLIVAMGKNRMIGLNNQMPWHLPDDLKYFKAQTLNKPVLMGRKTFESIGSRPLPKRLNIVISRAPQFQAEGVQVYADLNQALQALQALKQYEEVMIMGGGQIYQQTLAEADRLYITEVDAAPQGDTFFPEFDAQQWQQTQREHHPADDRHAYAFDFVQYERKS